MQWNRYPYEPVQWMAFVLLLVFLPLLTGCENSSSQQVSRPLPEVSVVTMEPQEVELTTELPGRTTAYEMAEIRPQVNGIILKRLFEEGSSVEAGDLLYQIDPAPFQATLHAAEASLGKAAANHHVLLLKAKRYEELLVHKAVSQQNYDDAVAALEQARAEIDYWKSEIEKALIQLKYTRVSAPISGRIGRSRVTDGALVTAYQATPLTTIQRLDPIYVDVTQSTSELLQLRRSLETGRLSTHEKNGQNVRIILEDGSPYPLEGKLQFRDVTSVDPATGSYVLRILVPNPDYLLLPGMFVRAVVKEGADNQAILVPQEGVGRNPKGEAVAFIVDAGGVVEERKLIIDRAIGNKWLVASGLSAGDRVIVEGRLNIRSGQEVRVVSSDTETGNQKAAEQPPNKPQSSAESR